MSEASAHICGAEVVSVHFLKTDWHFWRDVAEGDKTFEVRFNDRHFRVGDTLILRDWNDDQQAFRHEINGTPEAVVQARVAYILMKFAGLTSGYVCMGLDDIEVRAEGGCKCKPGDGTKVCEREDLCREEWEVERSG